MQAGLTTATIGGGPVVEDDTPVFAKSAPVKPAGLGAMLADIQSFNKGGLKGAAPVAQAPVAPAPKAIGKPNLMAEMRAVTLRKSIQVPMGN